MRNRSQRNPTQGGSRDFPWYSFPNVVSSTVMEEWNTKRDWMKERKVHIPAEINWGWMEEVGLSDALEPFLTTSYEGTYGSFMCMAWRRLFRIQEPVYKELCVEFLATIRFRKRRDIFDKENITFCLGGERRELSLLDFARMTELYLPSELHTDVYEEFVESCIASSQEFNESNFWPTIANGVYQSGTAQESDIRSPIHRILHRLITNTVNQRQEGDKVPSLDLFFLWGIINPEENLDVPFVVADFLANRAAKERRGTPLCGGMLITKLAKSLGVFHKREAMLLTPEYGKEFSPRLFKRANIVVDNGGGNFSIPNDEPMVQQGRSVRSRTGEMEAEPSVIPNEDEMPMDAYNVCLRRYQDNLGRGINYSNMHLDLMMQHMHIQRPSEYPISYPYIPTWNELWAEHRGGAGGSGGGDDED